MESCPNKHMHKHMDTCNTIKDNISQAFSYALEHIKSYSLIRNMNNIQIWGMLLQEAS